MCSSATVYFSNESLDEAAVYAVSGSQQIRIGTVMSGLSRARQALRGALDNELKRCTGLE